MRYLIQAWWVVGYGRTVNYMCENANLTSHVSKAQMFGTRKEAVARLHDVLGAQEISGPAGWEVVEANQEQVAMHTRLQLRIKARSLFGIRGNVPLGILADRYEDEGMLEEAGLLRMKLRNSVRERSNRRERGNRRKLDSI